MDNFLIGITILMFLCVVLIAYYREKTFQKALDLFRNELTRLSHEGRYSSLEAVKLNKELERLLK